VSASARARAQGFCETGGQQVSVANGAAFSTSGGVATNWQRSFPSCLVTVYTAGTTTLASVFSDNSGTVLANPFSADTTGRWVWYADNGRYDVKLSGGGIVSPFTIGDIFLFDTAPAQIWSGLATFNAGLTSAGPNTLNGGGTTAGAWTNTGAWTDAVLHTFNAGITSSGPNTLNGGGTTAGAYTHANLHTFSAGITGSGSIGTLTAPYANLTAFPAACGANQFATQIAATPGCTQPSAANLSNGVTGSGAVVLANSPALVTPALGVATGTSLALGGGTALTTTNQSGTGNLCLVTNCALTTPTIGGGSTITRYNKFNSGTITFASVNGGSAATQSITVTGVQAADVCTIMQWSQAQTTDAILVDIRVTGANTIAFDFVNGGAGAATPNGGVATLACVQ
jgi:hypothetical protein